jgi:hypothetical protein
MLLGVVEHLETFKIIRKDEQRIKLDNDENSTHTGQVHALSSNCLPEIYNSIRFLRKKLLERYFLKAFLPHPFGKGSRRVFNYRRVIFCVIF